MNILLMGGAGYIGSHVVRALAARASPAAPPAGGSGTAMAEALRALPTAGAGSA